MVDNTDRSGVKGFLTAMFLALAGTASMHAEPAAAANPCTSSALTSRIHGRSPTAQSGSAFVSQIYNSSGPSRDAAVVRELSAGNIPDFLRKLKPVYFRDAAGTTEIVACVMPDYLAVGSNSDFVRTPMGLGAALTVADKLGFMLPTKKMVDAIYSQAQIKLTPLPMTPSLRMQSTAYFNQHNASVNKQVRGRLGPLTAGQKKDLVLTNRLFSHPGRVAIYGWHDHGSAIQPLSTVHGQNYADYSHGIRLVSRTLFVNGSPMNMCDVLSDRKLASIISSEGPITGLAGLIAKYTKHAPASCGAQHSP